MKLILTFALVLFVQLLQPLTGGWGLMHFDGPTYLWMAISALAIASMSDDRAASGPQVRQTVPNALRDSSFSSSRSFLSPNQSL